MWWPFKRKATKNPASAFDRESYPRALTTSGQIDEMRKAGYEPVGNPDDDRPIKWKRIGGDA